MLNNGPLLVPELAVTEIFLQGLYRCHPYKNAKKYLNPDSQDLKIIMILISSSKSLNPINHGSRLMSTRTLAFVVNRGFMFAFFDGAVTKVIGER